MQRVQKLLYQTNGYFGSMQRMKNFFKIPSRPGEATENHYLSHLPPAAGGTPQTPLTEMEDRRATVTDALQSTTFRLYSSAAASVTGAGVSVPRQKVYALYSEIRNPQ